MVPYLLDHLVREAARQYPGNPALQDASECLDYQTLDLRITQCAHGLKQLGLKQLGLSASDQARENRTSLNTGDRVGIYLDKRIETVVSCFAAARAGLVFVPINPLLKPAQVAHILADCEIKVLITSPERLAALGDIQQECSSLHHCLVTGAVTATTSPTTIPWPSLLQEPPCAPRCVLPSLTESDLAAIFYTSGSTGKPKGVMLSHRNLVCGAASVASYLENSPTDRLLAALPLSFDAGFSQLTTAFLSGACVVLHNYLLAQDLLRALERERITGLTAVPPLYMQLTQVSRWPDAANLQLRYFANTGGRLPQSVLSQLRERLPNSQPFLMYGLTEAFRSTYLPPDQVDLRPDSIGKAIPNADVRVLRPDGTECNADEPGELVHSGPLVSLGYWNRPEATAERFKPLPACASGEAAPRMAVYSGDTVRRDAEGFLYFVGRRDEMIKSSGYRISPTEIEEVLYATGLITECCAFGISDPTLGEKIAVCAYHPAPPSTEQLIAACRSQLPAYMVPTDIRVQATPLPRNPNGKIDRHALKTSLTTLTA